MVTSVIFYSIHTFRIFYRELFHLGYEPSILLIGCQEIVVVEVQQECDHIYLGQMNLLSAVFAV